MDKNGILLIRDRWAEYEEILTDVDYGGFSYDYELNANRQLTFRVFKTPYNEFAYRKPFQGNEVLKCWIYRRFTPFKLIQNSEEHKKAQLKRATLHFIKILLLQI